MLYEYKGNVYPEYLKHGGASNYISVIAKHFCKGEGIDVGCGAWPLEGAIPVDANPFAHDKSVYSDALRLPDGEYDYVFSSHCLEHIENPIKALEHWKSRLKPNGVLFLYLPHPEMEYWLPQNCRKHLHQWRPEDMVKILIDLGFSKVIHSHRDLNWSFAVVGFNDVCI